MSGRSPPHSRRRRGPRRRQPQDGVPGAQRRVRRAPATERPGPPGRRRAWLPAQPPRQGPGQHGRPAPRSGCVLPTVSDPFFAAIAAEVETALAPRKLRSHLGEPRRRHGHGSATLTKALVERRVDALVVVSAPGDSSYLQLDIDHGLRGRGWTGRSTASTSTPSRSTTGSPPRGRRRTHRCGSPPDRGDRVRPRPLDDERALRRLRARPSAGRPAGWTRTSWPRTAGVRPPPRTGHGHARVTYPPTAVVRAAESGQPVGGAIRPC